MNQPLRILINGRERVLDTLPAELPLDKLLTALELRADRIAVELNGELAPRSAWSDTSVRTGDRLEVVHFVGGGSA